MSTSKITFPPGLTFPPGITIKPSGAGLWCPATEFLIDGPHSAKPTEALTAPAPAIAAIAPSPETVFQCQQFTSMIFNSSYPHEQAYWVHELTSLTLSLSAQLTASRNDFAIEAARSAHEQAINHQLRKNLAVAEEALATTANMLAVQAANVASAHASLGDERAIAAAAIKDLVLKEEALEATTAMLNSQSANLEFAHASLREKDQKIDENNKKIREKNIEIFIKNLEIQEEKQLAGEAISAKFAEHREVLSKLIVSADCERLTDGSDEGSRPGSPVNSRNSELEEALAEKVKLLMVEEHRSARLRNLLNQSIMEVSRLKICLEEATDPARDPLPGNVYPLLMSPESQGSSTQIAELKDALAEKSDFLKVEEQRSARLRDLLNQSIMEVGRLKICLEEATSSEEKGQSHEKAHQASDSLNLNKQKDSGQIHKEECPASNTDGSESSKDDGNGSALSTATTQVQDEEPCIIHISEGVLLGGEEPRGEPTTAVTEGGNHGLFVISTDEGNFTLSSLDEDDPYMKEEHKDTRSAPAPYF
ncbi:hypothetical protein B9Z19DRAFT_1168210 [Tuber borchii]|uniref:Uncharacterized protein n=1 Tax=Tuber borchii TaxID=42251 RepID=A0A2T7A063_TUBBO|nr:hypothetical protein B9Z19DRAFT_1168210 [Tuber borchii]